MMNTDFNNILMINQTEVKVFGVCEAFILARLRRGLGVYQTGYIDDDKTCTKDGRNWTHISVEKLAEYFGTFSESTIERAMKNLRKQGVIIVAHYGHRFDRTNWYAIDQKVVIEIIKDKGFLWDDSYIPF